MPQQIKNIKLQDLVLWTENPRDPIDQNATDQDVVNRALFDKSSKSKWSLAKLAREMGDYYDLSELPTVVFHDGKPIVYDGNRRIILGKIKHSLVKVPETFSRIKIPDFPTEIPCNVCTQDIALQNVLRKHGDSGTWDPLERDIFLHKFMRQKKSTFLILEEQTGLISKNPHLNQGFVRDEILRNDNFNKLGFSVQGEKVYSIHSSDQAQQVLSDISDKIREKKITTRKNRGKVIEVLEPSTRKLIDKNKGRELNQITLMPDSVNNEPTDSPSDIQDASQNKNKAKDANSRVTKRSTKRPPELFGGKLYLQFGETSDLYRDITDLYTFYMERKSTLSSMFPSLIRMSLRLLCETAAKEKRFSKFERYLHQYYDAAKKNLDQDQKTTLSNQGVDKEKIVQLLHTGAHNYTSANNIDQTVALSIIIGEILKITHGKE